MIENQLAKDHDTLTFVVSFSQTESNSQRHVLSAVQPIDGCGLFEQAPSRKTI